MGLGLGFHLGVGSAANGGGHFVYFQSIMVPSQILNAMIATGSADSAARVVEAIQSASIVNGDLLLTYDNSVITSVAMTGGNLIVTYGE